jgi:hypothetical protein
MQKNKNKIKKVLKYTEILFKKNHLPLTTNLFFPAQNQGQPGGESSDKCRTEAEERGVDPFLTPGQPGAEPGTQTSIKALAGMAGDFGGWRDSLAGMGQKVLRGLWRDSLAGLAGLHPNVGNCGGNCGGMAKTSSDLKGIFFVIL